MKRIITSLLVVILILPFTGCATRKPQVTRLNPDEVHDLTGEWGSSDARTVADKIVDDCVNENSFWFKEFQKKNPDRRPRIIVGLFRNKSSVHIDREEFTQEIARQLTNNGKARFVAGDDQREALREERAQQYGLEREYKQYKQGEITRQEFDRIAEEAGGSWVKRETRSELAQETGADFMLQGTFQADKQRVGGEQLVTYQVDIELIDLESTERVWIGSERIRKQIVQSKYSW
ncbi:MAG: penicillin-binding protein activator LpoB [bacterium]